MISAEPAGSWWAESPRDEWPEDDAELLGEIESTWDEETGDRRQELVVIGQSIDHVEIENALTACLVTEDEWAAGPLAWQGFHDPFPIWESDEVEQVVRA